jgi:hypothetical protein
MAVLKSALVLEKDRVTAKIILSWRTSEELLKNIELNWADEI